MNALRESRERSGIAIWACWKIALTVYNCCEARDVRAGDAVRFPLEWISELAWRYREFIEGS